MRKGSVRQVKGRHSKTGLARTSIVRQSLLLASKRRVAKIQHPPKIRRVTPNPALESSFSSGENVWTKKGVVGFSPKDKVQCLTFGLGRYLATVLERYFSCNLNGDISDSSDPWLVKFSF